LFYFERTKGNVCPPQLFLLGGTHCEPSPVAWQRCGDIGLNFDMQETTIHDWQDWLRDQVIGKIRGG
jgi:hypothetical protein